MTTINGNRLQQRIGTLAEMTEAPPYTRRSFTDTYVRGRRWLAAQFREAGLDVFTDEAGNLWGRLDASADVKPRATRTTEGDGRGTEPAPIVIGSHSDTVVGGGRFDGILGVLAALEVAETIKERGIALGRPLEIVDFLAEEPSAYGVSCVGSRALVGALTPDLLDSKNPEGETLAEAIRRMGGNPDALTKPVRSPGNVAAFLELHIEQGRVLEDAGKDIGIVTGIVGIQRLDVTIGGRADHAGATPMALRHDALVGAARIVEAADRLARQWHQPIVATVGQLSVEPNASNVVPGQVRLSLEVRSGDVVEMEQLAREILAEAEAFAKTRGLTLAYEQVTDSVPALCAPEIREAVRAACMDGGFTFMELPSGAGHDAAFMARICPSGMIFIPCRDGRSHSADEWAEPEQMAVGAETLYRAVLRLDESLGE